MSYQFNRHSNTNSNHYTPRYYNTKSAWRWFGIITIGFIILWILNLYLKDKPDLLEPYFKKDRSPVEKVGNESKGETVSRKAAEKIFNKKFIKVRPDFLKNAVTGHNLEIDIYNDELKLGIEYSGRQHYAFVPFFHKNKDAFQNQQYRDEIKRMKCSSNGVKLIEIPYTVPVEDIESFIRVESKKLGLL